MAWGGSDSPRRRGGFRRGAGGTMLARGRNGATASSSGPGALNSPGHSSTKRRAAATSPPTARMLDHGADKSTFQWMSPFQTHRCLGDHRILRMFFVAGVDITAREVNGKTFEEVARARLVNYRDLQHIYAGSAKKYASLVEVIDSVRLAGSYKQYILQDYKQLLRIRSLLARGRATMASSTPEVIARLFGGTAAASRRPPTRRSQPPPQRSAGVPDPIFWKVLEYWRLGDWRRPCTLPA